MTSSCDTRFLRSRTFNRGNIFVCEQMSSRTPTGLTFHSDLEHLSARADHPSLYSSRSLIAKSSSLQCLFPKRKDMAVAPDVVLAITRKKCLYGRLIDTKQWDKFSQVALPSCQFRMTAPDGSLIKVGNRTLAFDSSADFVDFFKGFFAPAKSLHMFGPPDMEYSAEEGGVQAIWTIEDEIILPSKAGLVEIRGGGHYFETWQAMNGEWFLSALHLVRTYQKTAVLVSL